MTAKSRVYSDVGEFLEAERRREAKQDKRPIPPHRARALLALEQVLNLPTRARGGSKYYRSVYTSCYTCASLAVDLIRDEELDRALLAVAEGFRMLTTGLERIARDADLESLRGTYAAEKKRKAQQDASRILEAGARLRRLQPKKFKSTRAALEEVAKRMKREPAFLARVLPDAIKAPSAGALKQRLTRAAAARKRKK